MIVTISTGSYRYAEMAYNLAVSARFLVPDVKVSVITDGNIRESQRPIFDHVIPFEGNPFEAKTMLPRLTPYSKTLYLDADTVCLPGRSLKDFLISIRAYSFAVHNYGWFDKGQSEWLSKWATVEEIQRIAGSSNKVPAYQSSAIYFDNSPKVKEFFAYANDFYAKIQSKVTVKGFQPDELAFSCAGAVTGMDTETDMLIAFCDTPGTRTEILNRYQFLSLAGPIVPNRCIDLYRNVVSTAAKRMGLFAYPFDIKAKRM